MFGINTNSSGTGYSKNSQNGNDDVQSRDNEDDEVATLLRSGSSISLPIRSLSPFRAAIPQTNSLFDNDASSTRSNTPEPVLEPEEQNKEGEEEEEEEEELGKDLFQLQFRKSLLKALTSFTEPKEKPSLPSVIIEEESPKVEKTPATPKKTKTPKRTSRHPTEDLPPQKLLKRDASIPPAKRTLITRASAAKFTKDSPDSSTYFNVSQSKVHIFKAAEEGNLGVVLELLPYTGTTIRKGKRRQSLLHVSAARGQSDVVMHLMNLISPNTINKDGQTPAHLAAMNGHTHILKIMFADNEFDPDLKDNWQRSFRDMLVCPLFEASLLGNKRKIEVLLELGADPDYHAGKLVEGILSRELKVTTARQLAAAMYGEPLVRIFSKERKEYVNCLKVTFTRLPKTTSKKQSPSQSNAPAMLLA